MKTISNKFLIYGDENYSHAVNYCQRLYNNPITLNFGDKHNRSKYILSSGACDNIEILQDGIFIYVISQNNGLSYIGMQVFNIEIKKEENNIFLSEEDCTNEENFSYGILDMDTHQQINILSEYL